MFVFENLNSKNPNVSFQIGTMNKLAYINKDFVCTIIADKNQGTLF